MAKYIPYDYNQNAMVVVNFQDQIQPGTFEHALHYLIEHKLDLSVFDPEYRNDENGRPAYDPAILLKIILFAYSKGITSSREIEWCCKTNIIFKALSCDSVPHFTTIASFVSSFPAQIEAVFEQVLLVCHQQGLLGNELFAIDGCKLPSNAAKQWSGTFKELEGKRKKLKKLIRHHLQRHRELDSRDDGAAEQQQRTEQTIATLNAAADRIGEFLKKYEPRMGKAKRPQEVKSNITDNDSAKMTTSKGTIQGYNGIAAVDSKHQIVIAKGKYAKKPAVTGKPWDGAKREGVIPAREFSFDAQALICRCPAGNLLSYRGTRENRDGDTVAHFEGKLLQCRHCPLKTRCMYNPASADHRTGNGRQVSFVVKRRKQSTTPYTDWMKARIDSEEGKTIYSKRMSVVEPVFGNLTTNKRLRRFSLRGQKKVQGQWQLFCLVHNIEKLQNFGSLAQ